MDFKKILEILDREDHFRSFSADELWEQIPELHALIGREQRADYHPEGDAFVHTLLVIDQAQKLSPDQVVRFCALTHDYGKAVTIQTKPGSHYDHESLGVPIVEAFCDRIGAPLAFRNAAVTVCKEHLNVHRFLEMKGVKRVRFIRRVWQYVDVLATCGMADARGRGPTFENDPYPQADALCRCAATMRAPGKPAPSDSEGWAKQEQREGRFLEQMFPRQRR